VAASPGVAPVSSRPTTINLDDETKAIAATIPNLSWFVREALRTHRDLTKIKMVPDHTTFQIDLECCNPFGVYGVCSLCWPDGPPLRSDWLNFSRMKRAGTTVDIDRKPLSHRDLVSVNALHEPIPGSSGSAPKHLASKKGLIRRFWAFCW